LFCRFELRSSLPKFLLGAAKALLDLALFGNIAIGFEHQAVTKQLHMAIDDDLAAIFADVMQLSQPVPPIPELRAQVGKINRKFSPQQSVACMSYRFVRRETVKPLGPCVPELDRPVQSPRKHRFVG
jgi:hypothetical protein